MAFPDDPCKDDGIFAPLADHILEADREANDGGPFLKSDLEVSSDNSSPRPDEESPVSDFIPGASMLAPWDDIVPYSGMESCNVGSIPEASMASLRTSVLLIFFCIRNYVVSLKDIQEINKIRTLVSK